MIVKLRPIQNDRIDIVNIEFLNLSDFLNRNDVKNQSLRGKTQVVHFDRIDSVCVEELK